MGLIDSVKKGYYGFIREFWGVFVEVRRKVSK